MSVSTEACDLLNRYFQSVFSEKTEDTVADDLPDPTLMNFDVSSKRIRASLTNLDVSKTRGPDKFPACFLKQLAEPLSLFLSAVFRNIKRLGKIPNCWKIGDVSPIHKKGCRASVKNYRPVTLLSIVSKVLEQCMYDPIEKQFSGHLTTSQHGFVNKRSVVSNMLCFLNDVQVALEGNPNSVYYLYTDFSKAFDRVPHAELLIKVRRIGVGGCVLSLLKDYLCNRKQFVRCDGVRSDLQVSSGVPQGSILGPLIFCIFINDLPTALISSTPYLYADDAKFLFIDKSNQEIQKEVDRISLWVSRNRMSLAAEKCCYIAFKGQYLSLTMNNNTLEQSTKMTDLGVQLTGTLKAAKHLESRLAKANRTFGFLKRNLSKNMETRVKICAYKPLILPLITFASSTWHPSRGSMRLMECFQKHALKWITGYRNASYFENMVSLRLLPLPMFLHLNDLLLLSKLYHDKENALPFIETYEHQYGRVKSRLFKIPKLRTEKFRENFYFRTANNLPTSCQQSA